MSAAESWKRSTWVANARYWESAGITSLATPLSPARQVNTACVAGSAADAWQSSDMFPLPSRRCYGAYHPQFGSEVEVRSLTCTLETLTWPSSPFLGHTDWIGQWTLLWPRYGTWLVIVRDGGRCDPPPVKRIGEWVRECRWFLNALADVNWAENAITQWLYFYADSFVYLNETWTKTYTFARYCRNSHLSLKI